MPEKSKARIAVIGIDIGKNCRTFPVRLNSAASLAVARHAEATECCPSQRNNMPSKVRLRLSGD
jgi:hypothetical protein